MGHAGSFLDQPWSVDNLDWLSHFGGTEYGEPDALRLALFRLTSFRSSTRNVFQRCRIHAQPLRLCGLPDSPSTLLFPSESCPGAYTQRFRQLPTALRDEGRRPNAHQLTDGMAERRGPVRAHHGVFQPDAGSRANKRPGRDIAKLGCYDQHGQDECFCHHKCSSSRYGPRREKLRQGYLVETARANRHSSG